MSFVRGVRTGRRAIGAKSMTHHLETPRGIGLGSLVRGLLHSAGMSVVLPVVVVVLGALVFAVSTRVGE